MAPKLYYFPVSPPCRAVLMVAKAIELDLELEEIEKEQLKSEEMLELNPQHTVPILVDSDEDFTIWDSHAIAGYLVGKYAEDDSLYPKEDVRKRALIDQRLHFENGVYEKFKACFLPLITGTADEISEEHRDSVLETLGFLEAFLNGKPWFAGDDVTIADLSLLATLATLEVIFPIDEDRFPQLVDWLQRAKELPYFEECNATGLETFKSLLPNNEG